MRSNMFVHPKYTPQAIADINSEFNQQTNSWLATLEHVESTFGISKQRQRLLINAGRVPGVTKLDNRNYIYRRAEAFEFYAGYAEYNNVDTSPKSTAQTYIDPYSHAVVTIPPHMDRQTYFDQWYNRTYEMYVAPFEVKGRFMTEEENAAWNARAIPFNESVRLYEKAILG